MGGMFCPIVPTVGQAAASTCLSLFLFSLPGHKWIPALGYCFCHPSLLGGNAILLYIVMLYAALGKWSLLMSPQIPELLLCTPLERRSGLASCD